MRVLFVQPDLNPPGGGNGVAGWMIQALVAEHEVAALTWEPPDFASIDRFFGTSLQAAGIRLFQAPARLRRRVDRLPLPLGLLRGHLLLRECRRIADDYDVVLTANNESDLGPPGIQYVHYPKFDPTRPAVDLRWYHPRAAVRAYTEICGFATGFSLKRMRRNVTLANSSWTAERIRTVHGIEPFVVHPPVAGDFPDVPWTEREPGFVCIGRISPEKRIDVVIDILARLRTRHEEIRLHIVGTCDDPEYHARISALAAEHATWITLHEDISRNEVVRLITGQRYGIHAMRDEHFGMGVAEMIRGGCIVFAPNDGGQVEIIDNDDLLYESDEDAVAKIGALLDDEPRQHAILDHLRARATDLSADAFVSRIRQLVTQLDRSP